ncbi:PqqD family peptide modification chaperone [Peptostreptococcaceae bacterium AGR-M142]
MLNKYRFDKNSIPVKEGEFKTIERLDGGVSILIERNDFFNSIKKLLFNTPQKTAIDLDLVGSDIWKLINGQNSVSKICNIIKNKYKFDNQSVNFRVEGFIHSFAQYHFIYFKENDDDDTINFNIEGCN